MVWVNPPQVRKSRLLVFVTLPLAFTLCYFLSDDFTRYYGSYSAIIFPPSPQESRELDWWANLFTRLESARPLTAPIVLEDNAPGENWKPEIDHARPDVLYMSPVDEAGLFTSHSSFVAELPDLVRRLPFNRGTTGIVTTAGVGNFGQVVTLVVMLRQSGSRFPVEIILDTSKSWMDDLCDNSLRKLNATCIKPKKTWSRLSVPVPDLKIFQWKAISMVASTFQNILFLDADCFPALNPDPIFAPASEPFASTGFITWPDFWAPTASKYFYSIAGNMEPPPLSTRTTSESGIMVLDKSRHADTLLLSTYYNYYGPDYYYTLLTQHGPGEGDKETFLHAALVLEALSKKQKHSDNTNDRRKEKRRSATNPKQPKQTKGYYDVKTMPRVHGQLDGPKNEWRGLFMQQMDPMEDYRATQAAKHRRDDATETETQADPKRFMFFHHNGVKLDFSGINDDEDSRLLATDWTDVTGHGGGRNKGVSGMPRRLWGDPGWIAERTGGRDVEREMWRGVMEIWCSVKRGGKFRRACAKMGEVWEAVYV